MLSADGITRSYAGTVSPCRTSVANHAFRHIMASVMHKVGARLLLVSILCGLAAAPAWVESDKEIKQQLIRASIASYQGTCPCPYSTDRAGRSCGKRSAYSRPGGR